MGVHVFPILNPLPPPSPSHPSGPSQCTSPEHPVSCIQPGLALCFTYDNIHISMLFSQIIPPSPSPTESKSLFFTSVSAFSKVKSENHVLEYLVKPYHFLPKYLHEKSLGNVSVRTHPNLPRLMKA